MWVIPAAVSLMLIAGCGYEASPRKIGGVSSRRGSLKERELVDDSPPIIERPSREMVQVTDYSINKGALYTGSMLDGKQQGFGTQVWPNRVRYTGQWKEGKMIRGTLFFPSGMQYNGPFVDNKPTGFSSMLVYPDGSRYIGNVVNLVREGTGKLTTRDGRVYEGTWSNGLMNGRGKVILPDTGDTMGSTYTGELKNNVAHGDGVIRFRNGDSYYGDWENGQYHGQGSLYLDGQRFHGQFEHGKYVPK